MRVLVWNCEWRSRSRMAASIRDYLWNFNPDLVCLTETHFDFPPAGHRFDSDPDYGYPMFEGRRKVALWSSRPFSDASTVVSPACPPGRFASAVVETVSGPLRVIGVCIPWSAAHVSTGRKDMRPWESHIAYLRELGAMLDGLVEPYIVVGDFNQRIPRDGAPRRAYEALQAAILDRAVIATEGLRDRNGRLLIDHLAHSPGIQVTTVETVPNLLAGNTISDHVGFVADIRL